MGKDNNAASPGEIFKLQFPVTVSLLLLIAILLLTAGFIWVPNWRSQIEFFGISAGVGAGILSAYYVGRGLQITIEQRDKALSDEKISRAFSIAARWNEPNLARTREQWRRLLDEIEGKDAAEVCDILNRDPHKKAVAADVLNFFEEVGYAARSGVIDMGTLKNVHRSLVIHYFSTILPWIEKIRRDKHQPTAYEHFEWLSDQWS